MVVKTRKYALPKKHYLRLAYAGLLRKQWLWIAPTYGGLNGLIFVWDSWWWLIGSSVILALYLLFWLLQFVGVTYLKQSEILFSKLSYEIDSRQILIKMNPREGMPIPWSKVKNVQVKKDGFTFFLSIAQIVYLPRRIFTSVHEIKVLEALLRRKAYYKG